MSWVRRGNRVCRALMNDFAVVQAGSGLPAPSLSSELQALRLMTARGLGGLALPLTNSCSAQQQQTHNSAWLSAPLMRRFAGAAVQPVPPEEDVQLTENAIERLKELVDGKEGQHLRLTVEAGGCSGFSYKFDLDDGHQEGDRVFEAGGVRLVADAMSYEFVRGAKVDYSQELIKSAFEDCVIASCAAEPFLCKKSGNEVIAYSPM